MVEWRLFSTTSNPSEWDDRLLTCDYYNVFQSFGWGEYKRSSGWIPHRYIAKNKGGAVVAIAQILIKPLYGGVKLCWSAGGPVFCFRNFKVNNIPDLLSMLCDKVSEVNGKRSLIRFYSHADNNPDLSYQMSRICFKSVFKINSGYSIRIDLSQPIESILAEMTSKHRYYVKKALKQEIQWKAERDMDAVQGFLLLHNEMLKQKRLRSLKTNIKEVSNMLKALNEDAFIFSGYIESEQITSCLVLTFGDKAFYMLAATSEKGRKANLSYSMVYNLFEYLKKKGINEFDFGGIATTSAAAGVNHFKSGFGGEILEYLGEWDWATSKWLRWGLNLAVKFKKNFA